MPYKRLFVFGLLGVFMFGLGVGNLSGAPVSWYQASAVVGLFLMLAVLRYIRLRVLTAVRKAVFDWLKGERSKVCWTTYGIDFFPKELVEKEKQVLQNVEWFDGRVTALTKSLWGNLLFFLPGRVDRYVLGVMASKEVEGLLDEARRHVRMVEELNTMLDQAKGISKVVPLRRGGVEAIF
ncbi:MAG: hypothetical protein EON60_10075 [Alphaproteobacteria bacterium]|nr:MAG: hypothetical protein EON60_10075 [Alphaproteobacteria bacterium]